MAAWSYNEALDWLYATQKTGIKLGLENTERLLDLLGNPHLGLKYFHVAGTNGKGSVCAMLESALRGCGYRTALFTSPHLIRFGERMKVDGQVIPDARLVELLRYVHEILQEHPGFTPTFFEITTAVGLLYFREADAEITVLETGMGGRLDSTNIITPLVSVITKIDLDHTQWLGNTLPEIAGEKAGIIKPGIPVVTVPQTDEVMQVLQEKSSELKSCLVVSGPVEFEVGLKGSHQKINAGAVVSALELSSLAGLERNKVERALAETCWPGRFQQVTAGMILDGAHNPAAIERLLLTWHEVYPDTRPTILFGALRDKNAWEMLRLLRELSSDLVLCPVRSERALPLEEMVALAREHDYQISTARETSEALRILESKPRPALITGSLFLIGETLGLLEKKPFEQSRQ